MLQVLQEQLLCQSPVLAGGLSRCVIMLCHLGNQGVTTRSALATLASNVWQTHSSDLAVLPCQPKRGQSSTAASWSWCRTRPAASDKHRSSPPSAITRELLAEGFDVTAAF